MPEAAQHRVDFEPLGRRVSLERGQTLLDGARLAGVRLLSFCGGVGACDGCMVRPMEGSLSQLTAEERAALSQEMLDGGMRLACQAVPQSDVKVHVPPESMSVGQRLQLEGRSMDVALDPTVIALDLQIDPPSLQDLESDIARLERALARSGLGPIQVGIPVLRELSHRLRAQGWQARLALRGRELIAVLPPDTPLLGAAIDVGTTKLAVYLVDLSSGRTLAKAGAMNPQISYGEDVISRIAYAGEQPRGRYELQECLVETLNGILHDLCQQTGHATEQVVDAVVVGNTAMHHLFAGLPVRQLGISPYVPSVSRALALPASEVGLDLAAGAEVYLPPVIAGYVGADHVGMLLSSDVRHSDRVLLALDIGTNTEISLMVNGRVMTCSCASGPAFEGAHIHDGMRASPGAIERVRKVEEQVRNLTVENEAPVGICGSGILDAITLMLGDGALDRGGRLLETHARVHHGKGRAQFRLVEPSESGHGRAVVVTGNDVREIQLAKGAIRAGIEILLEEARLDASEIDEILVAGAFGTYLDLSSAVRVGMFPPLPLERFQQVGNAAGAGARQMLVSARRRVEAEASVRGVEYIELTTHHRFTEVFVEALNFPLLDS